MNCRYRLKRAYPTRNQARAGARVIRDIVISEGRVYQQLHPYHCPDEDHWHLSHYPQGYKICTYCGQRAPAWNGGQSWVMSAHPDADDRPCLGEGSRV